MVIERAPLEDELGDVLDKAITCTGLTQIEIAAKAGVSVEALQNAIDYCGTFTPDELDRLSGVLKLNPRGLAPWLASNTLSQKSVAYRFVSTHCE